MIQLLPARDQHAKMDLNIKTIRDFVLSHTDLMGTVATPFAPVINAVTGSKPVKTIMHKTIGVHDHKSLPKYSHGTFRGWYKNMVKSNKTLLVTYTISTVAM